MTRAEFRSRAIVRAVPAWAWLAGIVVLSTGLRFLFARRVVAPSIMVDELVYSELAKSFAAHGHFLIRDVPAAGAYGVVYPLLIAAPYRLFAAVPDAYEAAKAVNSVLMSLAAVPAYFLARRVLDKPLALAAAALAVAIPSLLYTGALMTENAFYPLFLSVALALARMLERPTRLNQLAVLALCLVAYETRQQALALFPAVITAPLLLGPRGIGRFRLLYGAVAGIGALAVIVEASRGRTPLALLGAYESVGRHGYDVGAVAKWLVWHLAELDLYLGVIPVAAFLVLTFSWRQLGLPQRAFLATASSLSVCLIVEVAAFASLPGVTRIEERNLFYVAPFFLIALLLWIELGTPRPRLIAASTAAASGLLVGVLAFAKLVHVQPTADTLALIPWWQLHENGLSAHEEWLVVTVAALAAAALFAFVPSKVALVLPAVVLVYFAVAQRPIESHLTAVARASLSAGIGSASPDWIDRRVGTHADVAAIWTGRSSPYAVWENEFFNRSVGTVYRTGAAISGGLTSPAVTIGSDGSLRGSDGRVVRHPFVLSDGTFDVDGVKLAANSRTGINLWQVRGSIRPLTRVEGLYPRGTWSGRSVDYRRLGCDGGSVRVKLLGDANLFDRLQLVRAGSVSRLVVPGIPATLTAPLTDCRAEFTVMPTKVPGNGDHRRLGVHFLSFEYLPAS